MMREIDGGFKAARHAFMVSELAAIVISDGMNKVNKLSEQFCNDIAVYNFCAALNWWYEKPRCYRSLPSNQENRVACTS